MLVQIRRKMQKTNNAVIDRVNEVYERVIALGGKLAEEAQRRGIINNQLRSEMRQMQTNIEKAMAPDDTIEDKITAAVAKAMVAERQDSRRLRAMESQQMSAELENVRSSLLKEIEKRDVIIKDLTERVMKAHMMAATAVRPQGPPPTTPHPSELAKKAPKNNNKSGTVRITHATPMKTKTMMAGIKMEKETDSSEGTKRNDTKVPPPPPTDPKPLLQLTKGGKNANKHLNIPKSVDQKNAKQSMRLTQAKRAEAEAKRAQERQRLLKQNKSTTNKKVYQVKIINVQKE